MAEKSLIRIWRREPASFVEDKHDGSVIVAVGNERHELPATECDKLRDHEGAAPHHFDKPPQET